MHSESDARVAELVCICPGISSESVSSFGICLFFLPTRILLLKDDLGVFISK